MQPQINMESKLGQVLCELAHQCSSILEVGAGCGLGSTQCIMRGCRFGSSFTSLEGDAHNYFEASSNLIGSEFIKSLPSFAWTLMHRILSRTIQPYWHPDRRIQIQMREAWDAEKRIINTGQIYDMTPGAWWDMVFLDGGEFTTLGDFLTIWPHAKRFIVLDDCHPDLTVKNVESFKFLSRSDDWNCIHNYMQDRNGWAVFERMK